MYLGEKHSICPMHKIEQLSYKIVCNSYPEKTENTSFDNHLRVVQYLRNASNTLKLWETHFTKPKEMISFGLE